MKNNNLILLLLLLTLTANGAFAQLNQRLLFNDGWSFHKGDVSAGANGGSAEIQWQTVQLPHDWSIDGPFSEEWASATAYLPGGIGWYKKYFNAPANWKGKNVAVRFDGVYKNSEVWINGHYLGKRPNGFVPFQYDLSPYLKYNQRNLLTVKVDHKEFADSRWYTGSGIYRNVYLLVKNPIHIDRDDLVFSTPEVSASSASVQVKAIVTNVTSASAPVMVKISLTDPKGKIVGIEEQRLQAKPGNNEVTLNHSVSAPHLWSVKEPQLYQLQVQVIRNGTVIDEETEAVGFRSIRFDKDNGFFLNGQNLKLKGLCIHDDAGALGVAVPPEVWVRRLKALKEAGVNALRLSHNPHADYLYDLCDQMGFLVMDEAFDEWEIGKNKWVKGWNVGTPSKDGYHEYFKEWAHRDLEAMIKRDRNHPSVILWSIGNEIDYPNDPYTHPVLNSGRNPQIYGKGYLPDHPPASEITGIAKDLVKTVKAFDTTRPVTAALAGVVMSNEVGYPDVLDIVGYNYQEFRYAEDHQQYPNRIIYGSENGMQRNAWEAVDTNKYISGQFLWTGIDYLGEAGKWPQRSNGAGLIDLAGFKKPEYYYRQSLWAAKPMVYIGVRELNQSRGGSIWSHRGVLSLWNWDAGNKLQVECFTNCREAELFLNGRSLGKQVCDTAKGKIPVWNVDYQPGELLVKGYNNGNAVASYFLKTAGEPQMIRAVADRIIFPRSHRGISQIEIQIADQQGNPVYKADNEITVKVHGDAKLLGLESGSNTSHEDYHNDHRKALNGKLLAYIQTNGKAGNVRVEIQSSGLKPAVVKLTIR